MSRLTDKLARYETEIASLHDSIPHWFIRGMFTGMALCFVILLVIVAAT